MLAISRHFWESFYPRKILCYGYVSFPITHSSTYIYCRHSCQSGLISLVPQFLHGSPVHIQSNFVATAEYINVQSGRKRFFTRLKSKLTISCIIRWAWATRNTLPKRWWPHGIPYSRPKFVVPSRRHSGYSHPECSLVGYWLWVWLFPLKK